MAIAVGAREFAAMLPPLCRAFAEHGQDRRSPRWLMLRFRGERERGPTPLELTMITSRVRFSASWWVALGATAYAWGASPAEHASPDGATYLNAARHLAAGHGLMTSTLDWNDAGPWAPLALFGPGFPAAIALLLRLGVAGPAAVSYVVAASFVLYAVATWFVLVTALPHAARWLAVPGCAALVLQPAVRGALGQALSDLAGASVALLAAGLILRRASPTSRQTAGVGLVLGLAVLVRWANLYFACAALLALVWLGWPACDLARRARRVATAAIACALLVLPMWARNLACTGTLMGERPLALRDPLTQLALAFEGMSDWFRSAHDHLAGHAALGVLHTALGGLLAGCIVLMALLTRDRRARASWTMAIVYASAMVLSSSTTAYDPLSDSRFWVVVFPLVTAGAIRCVVAGPCTVQLKQLTLAAWLLLAGHATLVFAEDARHELALPRADKGYFSPHLDASRVIARAVALQEQGACTLASDEEFVLLPRVGTRSVRATHSLDDFAQLRVRRERPICLVLVRDPRLPWTLAPEFAPLRTRVQALGRDGRLTLDSSDDIVELWITHEHSR